MSRYIIFNIIAVVVFIAITIIIAKLAKKNNTKYWPAIAMSVVGTLLYLKGLFFSQSMEDLADYIFAMSSTIVAVFSLITAVILDIMKYRKKK